MKEGASWATLHPDGRDNVGRMTRAAMRWVSGIPLTQIGEQYDTVSRLHLINALKRLEAVVEHVSTDQT